MSKLDNIFQKVLANSAIADKYGIKAEKYPTVFQGTKAMDPHVKYIAKVLSDISEEVEAKKKRMAEEHDSSAVVLDVTTMRAVYNVTLPILNAEGS